MKRLFACILLLSPVTGPALAQDFTRILTEERFRDAVVGRTLSWATGTTVIHADGRTEGEMQGVGAFEGRWHWADGQYCRHMLHDGEAGQDKCLTVEIQQKTLRMTYDGGQGRSLDLAIE
jgi:hypothetical protein